MMTEKKKGNRHWSNDETKTLLSIWGEPAYQTKLGNCIHNHQIWEAIFADLCKKCPSVKANFDTVKCKDRIDYLKRRYRECIKIAKDSGVDTPSCPFYHELHSVLACAPTAKTEEGQLENSIPEDDSSNTTSHLPEPSVALSCDSPDPSAINILAEEDIFIQSSSTPRTDDNPKIPSPKHKGQKRKVIDAVEKGIKLLIHHDNRSREEDLSWERQLQQARLDLEKARLELEMKRMEAEDRRARENQQFMMELIKALRTPVPQYLPTPYFPPHSNPAPSQNIPADQSCQPTHCTSLPNPPSTDTQHKHSSTLNVGKSL